MIGRVSPHWIGAVGRLGARVAAVVGITTLLALASNWGPGALAASTTAKSGRSTGSEAAAGKAKSRTKTKTATKTTPKAKAAGKTAKTAAKTRANSKKDKTAAAKPAPLPPPKGKVAILAFEGDGANPLRARIVRLLRAKGLKVITTLRPVDTPEQYREMADTLVLVAFLDGEASEDGDQASVTVHVRSGVSGLRVASATLAGERRKLPSAIDHELWPELAPPLSRACTDAVKPRKREREPMRIEAGTPLGNDNPDNPPKGT
jgi:hypothetical protein